MEKIENKAAYYFGDKPVLEKAVDENEFEGAVIDTINTEEIIENILALGLSNFWNEIWIELVQLGCTIEIAEDYSHINLRKVSTMAQEKYPYGKSADQIFYENVSGALKKGWNWRGDTDIYVKQLTSPKTLAEAVISWLIEKRNHDLVYIRRHCMLIEPNAESAYENWVQFFDAAFNRLEHNITKFKGKPLRDVVLSDDGNTKLIKEGSVQDVKTFYDYFGSDLDLLFQQNLSSDNYNNPIRVAYIRGDPEIFRQIIKLKPSLFAKNQVNDRALQYAVQFYDVESSTLLLMNRQNRELSIKTTHPELNQLFLDFKQLSRDDFAVKYRSYNIEDQFYLTALPIELQCKILDSLSTGSALNSRSVCKFWRENIKIPAIMNNIFIKLRKFASSTRTDDYYLKIEVFSTVHHYCLADPKRTLLRVEPKDYNDQYLNFIDDLILRATTVDCLPSIGTIRKEEFRAFVLNCNAKEIYYWDLFGHHALYLKYDEDFGIGITLNAPVIEVDPLDDSFYA